MFTSNDAYVFTAKDRQHRHEPPERRLRLL
jgi:hypothetical protein